MKKVFALPNLTNRRQTEKSQLQTHTTFHEKGKMNQKAAPKAQRMGSRVIEMISRLCDLIKELTTSAWLGSGIATDPLTPLWNRTACRGYPLSHITVYMHGRDRGRRGGK